MVAPVRAWSSGAALPSCSIRQRFTLEQQAASCGLGSGAAWARCFSQPATPLLERETIAYMRSVRTGSEVYLIGTAHVSKASAEEVKEVRTQE